MGVKLASAEPNGLEQVLARFKLGGVSGWETATADSFAARAG